MHPPHPHRLDRDRAQLLVVDIQEKLLPRIDGHEAMLARAEQVIRAALVIGVPVTVSEQYVKGLGPTVARIRDAAGEAPRFEKLAFSFCDEPACRERIESLGRPQVILAGIETHVCVLQTALDLLAAGSTPFVVADAVGSRAARDYDVALAGLRSAGAAVTTAESAIFQLLRASGTALFKRVLPLVK
ncbi:MAG: hydrolase [Phycisphaerales bacterium]|nr:hydrolase [Phycisphaerales bacterium]